MLEVNMSEIVLNDKSQKPDESLLAEKLGSSVKFWREITSHVRNNYDSISEEWKFYGQKYGWQLKTFMKKRNLFFLIPSQDYFRIVFVFGDKAVAEIEKSDVAEDLKNKVKAAKKYAEGRGLPIEVRDRHYLADIKKLITIKISN
jgi:hypothetical protein